MKAYIIYHPDSETARPVEQYAHDFETFHSFRLDPISLETREGADLATLYGVVKYPALLVAQDNKQLMKLWEGLPFPVMDELAGYLNS